MDREHIVQMSYRDVVTFRDWLNLPNGALTLGRLTFEAVAGGGILVRTRPFSTESERVEITTQQTTWTPARDAEGEPLPLPTTGDTTVTDACPSRMITPEDRKIVHCDAVNHEMWANSLGTMHYTPGWQWSDKGAMPADRPCDKRCAQCVERVRDAVIDAARRYTNVADAYREQARLNLHAAMREYEKVMGL